jgi:tRNA threonylcarbamoyladenosine biosynthesis protein TsaE
VERIEFTSSSPSETIAIGEHIGSHAASGDLFTLYGELGAGKTQFVKGLARGAGVSDWQYVVSPSFTLMTLYEGRITLCHVDLYRLEGAEPEELEIDEYLDTGIVAVEWAERWSGWRGEIRVSITVTGDEGRNIVMEVEDVSRAEVWRDFRRQC